MSDLRCNRCGIERTYADANIADIHQSCETHPVYNQRGTHDWMEVSG